MGGLHKFINWPRGMLTDSGGFQVRARQRCGGRGATLLLRQWQRGRQRATPACPRLRTLRLHRVAPPALTCMRSRPCIGGSSMGQVPSSLLWCEVAGGRRDLAGPPEKR